MADRGLIMTLKLRSTLAIFASAIAVSGAVHAQKNYQRSIDYGVTIYEHCDFRGKSQTLKPGEYSSLRGIGFGNDSVSSIRVPRGNEAVIYRDDDFRGSYARIDKDIRCFDKQWNDEASSISVREIDYDNRDDGRYSRNDNRDYNNNGYDGRDYDNRSRDNRNRGGYKNRQNQVKVTAKNVSHVVFDGFSLQQVAKNQWSLDRNRGASKQYQEVRRDRDTVYLENQYTAERVRIDLFANDVTFVNRDGRLQRYTINRKNTAIEPNVRGFDKRNIRSECFNFKAYTKGGNAGVRFAGKKEFYRFNTKVSTGRICHRGSLVMEIGKTRPDIDAVVVINGNSFRFSAGEKEDRLLNNWYRKNIELNVGR